MHPRKQETKRAVRPAVVEGEKKRSPISDQKSGKALFWESVLFLFLGPVVTALVVWTVRRKANMNALVDDLLCVGVGCKYDGAGKGVSLGTRRWFAIRRASESVPV